MSENHYDILIVGGGLVGASLACALQATSLRVAIIEAAPWFTHQRPPSYDDRILALNYVSQRIFTGIGIWSRLAPHVTPIRSIHVSEQGQWGFTHLDNKLLGVPALGYVVTARQLGEALFETLSRSSIQIFSPAKLHKLRCDEHQVQLQIFEGEQERTLQTRLLVAADGENSQIRKQIGLSVQKKEYDQVAIIANVTTERPHQYQAYERFTPSGPFALLPLRDRDCGLIWTVRRSQSDQVKSLNTQDFLSAIQQQFGWRLGQFVQVGRRDSYPLHFIHTPHLARSRVIVIGNAAHTVHPIAGQGFNLGLRDVASLAQVIIESQSELGGESMLQHYLTLQQPDQQRILWLTDNLVKGFSHSFLPLKIARNLGLWAVESLPLLKKPLMRQMAGLNSYPSRLVRGLPLVE